MSKNSFASRFQKLPVGKAPAPLSRSRGAARARCLRGASLSAWALGLTLALLPTVLPSGLGAPLGARVAWGQNQDYKLAADDVLSVAVLDHPELTVARIQVDPGGKVRLPSVGSLSVTGKTVAQVAEAVRRELAKELRHPDVTVTLLQARPQRVFVSGAVQKPGVFEIGPGWRISEVLTAAGGLGARPELVSATLSRGQSPAIALDLKTILRDSSNPANLKLRVGDVIRVSELTLPVRVAGQVKTPGSYDVPGGATIGDALALAGGLAPRAAARRVTVTRGNGDVTTLDLSTDANGRALNAGDSALKLAPGDLIVVPESTDRIAVLGAVQKPGYYDVEVNSPLRLAQALNVAGGANPKAALTRATLMRAGTSVPLDLFSLIVAGDQSKNIELQPGDIVTVPEATGVTVFGAVNTPGTYTVQEGRAPRVLDVLTLAGGLSVAPQDARVRVLHKEGVGLQAGALSGDASTRSGGALTSNVTVLNERVFDGDLITVEALRPMTITVGGEVNKPAVLEVRPNTSLVDVITRAGGKTDKATLSDVTVLRADNTSEKVDLYDALVKGEPGPNFELRDGDYVSLQESKRKIYVYGAVSKPDYYAVPEREPLTVAQSLSLAGGPRTNAKIQQVGILRKMPDGSIETNVLNLVDNKSKKDDKNDGGADQSAALKLETLLQAGDAIYVPEGKQSLSTWQKIASIAGAANIFRIF